LSGCAEPSGLDELDATHVGRCGTDGVEPGVEIGGREVLHAASIVVGGIEVPTTFLHDGVA
jgi:hypothetical protein